jgi:hypothetical protein
MTEIDEDFKEDELINIKLPRSQYELLKVMIKREQAYNWFTNWMRNNVLWVIGGGILTFLLLYDKIQLYIYGTVK